MKLLEYEAKLILEQFSIPVPKSKLVKPSDKPSAPCVLKSQVPVGGRGKMGGIVILNEDADVVLALERLFELELKGFKPSVVLAEEILNINKEFYLSIVIDRDTSSVQLVVNKQGGVEVEGNSSDSFLKITLDTQTNFDIVGEQVSEWFDVPSQTFVIQDMVSNLYKCFVKSDATLLEINPLILTSDERLVAGDCKMELDDAASFRHPEWSFEDKPSDVNFVTLNQNGRVATIANGAGLAMATVDAVVNNSLTPANFLDIGGGANEASVLRAFQKITEYPNISAIVINIFAGITRCDEIAKAIIAAKNMIPSLPKLYIRLAGTNYEVAEKILSDENINLLPSLERCLEAVKEDML